MSLSPYYQAIDPETGRIVLLCGSRALCDGCLRVFSGESAFDRHREGRFEPDERRCLSPLEMAPKGLFRKESGVWGRHARRLHSTGTAASQGEGEGKGEDGPAQNPLDRPSEGDATQTRGAA
jgi:hypothetical protein